MPPRFYLLHGPDEFASANMVKTLQSRLGDATTAALNVSRLDGKSVTLGEVRSACDALPFMAAQRLVVVEGWLTRLAGKGAADEETVTTTTTPETVKALAAYLPNLPTSTVLVCVEKDALPERHPILQLAARSDWAEVKFFGVPKGEALVRWIMDRAREVGGAFTPAAAAALAAAERDPRALDNEIAKLLAYGGYARPVEVADVEQLVPLARVGGIFELVDAIGQRRAQTAMRHLNRLLEKEAPLYVLGMIVRQFRLLLQAGELLSHHASEAEVARTLGLHPYPAGKVCSQTRNFSLSELEHIYHRLRDYDLAIKTGKMEAATALEVLVATLTTA